MRSVRYSSLRPRSSRAVTHRAILAVGSAASVARNVSGCQPIHSSRSRICTMALDSAAIPMTGWNVDARSRTRSGMVRPGVVA